MQGGKQCRTLQICRPFLSRASTFQTSSREKEKLSHLYYPPGRLLRRRRPLGVARRAQARVVRPARGANGNQRPPLALLARGPEEEGTRAAAVLEIGREEGEGEKYPGPVRTGPQSSDPGMMSPLARRTWAITLLGWRPCIHLHFGPGGPCAGARTRPHRLVARSECELRPALLTWAEPPGSLGWCYYTPVWAFT